MIDLAEKHVWSTDPDTERRLHALQAGVPMIAAQYKARSEVDLKNERINLIFSKSVALESQVECWSRVSHMLKLAGVDIE